MASVVEALGALSLSGLAELAAYRSAEVSAALGPLMAAAACHFAAGAAAPPPPLPLRAACPPPLVTLFSLSFCRTGLACPTRCWARSFGACWSSTALQTTLCAVGRWVWDVRGEPQGRPWSVCLSTAPIDCSLIACAQCVSPPLRRLPCATDAGARVQGLACGAAGGDADVPGAHAPGAPVARGAPLAQPSAHGSSGAVAHAGTTRQRRRAAAGKRAVSAALGVGVAVAQRRGL